jgi:hypothetical protein
MSKIHLSPSDTIERCPHDKEHPYTMISNNLIRDNSISPQCRWLISYFLSNKSGWVINVSQVINHLKDFMGRDSVYNLFNEALEAGYLRKEIIKKGNLKQNVKYYVVEFPELKKCFRHPESRDTETRDTENQHYKNKPSIRKNITTTTIPAMPVVVPLVKEEENEETLQKKLLLQPYEFSKTVFNELMNLSLDQIEKGIKAYDQQAKTKKMSKGALITAIREGWKPNKNQKQIDTEKQLEKEDILRINKSKCISLVRENELKFTDEYKMVINEYYIAIKVGKDYNHISYLDPECIEIIEQFIKNYLN